MATSGEPEDQDQRPVRVTVKVAEALRLLSVVGTQRMDVPG